MSSDQTPQLTCQRTLELEIPWAEVEAETARVVGDIQKKVRMPGFRPGKAPLSMIKSRFAGEIRQDVLESLIPKAFRKEAEAANLKVVGTPNVADLHFHDGEPLKFKAEFEVAPEFELGEYTGIEVPFEEPSVTEEDVDKRLESLREQKAEFVNEEPRPAAIGDYVAVSLKSIAGVEGDPVESDDMTLKLGDEGSMPEFTENLTGMSPGENKHFEVSYPDGYAHPRLSGRKVTFDVHLQAVRRKELPELNDEFAKDLGDYRDLGELRDELRKAAFREKEQSVQQDAKNKLIDKLVDAHPFAVPQTYVDRQIEAVLESRFRELAGTGIDLSQLKLDWDKVREKEGPRAERDVRASLLLEKVADRESIEVMNDEVDREIHRAAKQLRQPAAAVRMQMEKDGGLHRIAGRIRTEKVLNFLFDQARKVAPQS